MVWLNGACMVGLRMMGEGCAFRDYLRVGVVGTGTFVGLCVLVGCTLLWFVTFGLMVMVGCSLVTCRWNGVAY